jgi:ribosome hibernation promoting factor
MNITVTFRHVDASDAIRQRATEKIAKLQKFLRQPMTARVTVTLEKLLHLVEARISSGGERYEAHDATEDMYASIDKVLDKLERQIRGNKGVERGKKRRGGATLRRGPVAEMAESPRIGRVKAAATGKSSTGGAKPTKKTAAAKSR